MTPDASSRDDWTRPGAFEVAAGVYRLPLPLPNDGLRAVNVYALVSDGDLMLIDSGWAIAGARAVLGKALGALGCSARDVRRVLVTHVHRDHYTQAVYLRREFGTRSRGRRGAVVRAVPAPADHAPVRGRVPPGGGRAGAAGSGLLARLTTSPEPAG